MRQAQDFARDVCRGENQKRLQNQRESNQHDVERVRENHFALPHENQHERQKKPNGRRPIELFYERLFEPFRALAPCENRPREDACGERNHHEKDDTQNQRVKWN